MSTHHAKLIRSIFDDPPGHNIRWRDVESLLQAAESRPSATGFPVPTCVVD